MVDKLGGVLGQRLEAVLRAGHPECVVPGELEQSLPLSKVGLYM